MIGTVVELVTSEAGVSAAAGLVVIYVALWARRVTAVASYVRIGAVVAVLAGAGAVVGIVRVGRTIELASAGWRVLMDVVAYAGGVPA
jgi:hypothetical protein